MPTLSPSLSAHIASSVYGLLEFDQLGDIPFPPQVSNAFNVAEANRMEGSTGFTFIRSRTGFGYLALGQGNYAGEALIAMRGTAKLMDWGSNLNISVQRGPTGSVVHGGFNETFNSMKPDIKRFLMEVAPTVNRVHCVGHSLGGALATLSADYARGFGLPVSLYTFGSPRVGTGGFGRTLTQALGKDHINRVYHVADPVSMIPIFPFVHVPSEDSGIELPWNGWKISLDAHSMTHYIQSVGDRNWGSLRSVALNNSSARSLRWMEHVKSDGWLMGSAMALKSIAAQFEQLLRKILFGGLGLALTSAVTILDQLAYLLYLGARGCQAILEGLTNLVGTIMRFLGRSMVRMADVTVAFLRWLLTTLFNSVRGVAEQALNLFS